MHNPVIFYTNADVVGEFGKGLYVTLFRGVEPHPMLANPVPNLWFRMVQIDSPTTSMPHLPLECRGGARGSLDAAADGAVRARNRGLPAGGLFGIRVIFPHHGFRPQKITILLANPKVLKFVDPICLLGRQKSWGNFRKKKYS